MYDAEIVTVSLENSLGSIGGVTVGNEEVVDHQRLSGAGYCFSASSPPFTASAAMSSLQQLDTNPEIYENLQTNIQRFHEKLKAIDVKVIPDKLVCTSDERSAIIYFEINSKIASQFTHEYNVEILDDIAQKCMEAGIAIVSTTRRFPRRNIPSPAIRIVLSTAHTEEDIDQVLKALEKAVMLSM
jgi:serine palmitoyltransferase